MKVSVFDWILTAVSVVVLVLFIYSGFSNASRAKQSYAQATAALTADAEHPERFYGIENSGFSDFMRMIDQKAKRLFSGEGQVRGITNANGLVFVAFDDGHFAIVRKMETVQEWVKQESGRTWIIF